MTSLTVRNLPDDVKKRLRQRAAANGRSMEEEVRLLLAEGAADAPVAAKPADKPGKQAASEIAARQMRQHPSRQPHRAELPGDQRFQRRRRHARELRAQESKIERRVVRHEHAPDQRRRELTGNVPECRLVAHHRIVDADRRHRRCLGRRRARVRAAAGTVSALLILANPTRESQNVPVYRS